VKEIKARNPFVTGVRPPSRSNAARRMVDGSNSLACRGGSGSGVGGVGQAWAVSTLLVRARPSGRLHCGLGAACEVVWATGGP
jgi:hypothetical protein